MSGNAELATAYVSIVPSAKGIEASIAKELAPVEAAAEATGTSSGNKMSSGILSALGGISPKLVAGLGFAAIGVAAFSAATTVDDALDTIQIKTGATGKTAEGLEASFKHLGENSSANLGDIADVMATLYQKTGLVGGPLEHLTDQVTTFNRITRDSPITVDQLTRAMLGFNVPAGEMGDTLDRLFNVSQATGVPLSNLLDTLGSSGPILRQFNIPLEQGAGLLAQLQQAGVDVEGIIPGLKRVFVNFEEFGKSPSDALHNVIGQLETLLAKGDVAGAQNLASQIFGARGIGLVDAALSGKLSLQDLNDTFTATGDGILATGAKTDDFKEKLGRLKNFVTIELADVGKPLFDGLTQGAEDAVPVVKLLADGLGLIEPLIGPIALGVAAFYGASKLAVPVVGALSTGVQSLGQSLLNHGFDPEGRTVQGLASFANGLDRVGNALPGIAAAGVVAATSFSGIGESAGQSALGIGSLVTTGFLLGNAVLPGMGGAIGAATGLIAGMGKELFGAGESAEEFRRKLAGMAGEIEGLGAKKAATEFFAGVKVDAKGAGDEFETAKRHLVDLAEQSPGAAQRVVEGLRTMRDDAGKPIFTGHELDKFNEAIDAGGAKLQAHNQRKAEAQAVNAQYTSSENAAAAGIDQTTASLEAEISKLDEQQNKLLASYDALFASVHADESARDAIDNYTKALGDGSIAQDDLNRKLTTAEENAIRAAAAVGTKTEKDHEGEGAARAHAAGTQAQIDYLTNLASTLSPGDPLRVFLEEYIGKLNAIPPAKNTDVTANTETASRKIADYSDQLARLPASVVTDIFAGIYHQGAASGGDRPAGWTGWVGEQGPELVTFGADAHVYTNQDSMAMLNAASLSPAPLDPAGAGAGANGRTQNFYGDLHFHEVQDAAGVARVFRTLAEKSA